VILLLRHDATPAQAAALAAAVKGLGLDVVPLDEGKGRAFEVVGGDPSPVLALASQPGVEEILTRRTPIVGGDPLWPHFALRVGILAVLLTTALALLAAFLPVGLGDPAEVGAREAAGRPEWYLRPLDRLLSLVPAGLAPAGGALVAVVCLLVLLWPFLDRGDPATPRGRSVSRLLRAAGAAILVGIALLGVLP
jgi:quinol-cytochrome oxidoreductase complex cytochrome b subunit